MELHDSEKDWQENCLFNFIFVYYCLFNSGIQLCSATITSGLTYNMIYVSPNTRLIFCANIIFSTVEPIFYVLYSTLLLGSNLGLLRCKHWQSELLPLSYISSTQKCWLLLPVIQLILVFTSGELHPFFECAAALLSSRFLFIRKWFMGFFNTKENPPIM